MARKEISVSDPVTVDLNAMWSQFIPNLSTILLKDSYKDNIVVKVEIFDHK